MTALPPPSASWATPLDGLRVLVIGGGGGGNGSAITRAIGRAGAAHVVVADLDQKHADVEVDLVKAAGGSASALTCDVRQPEEMTRVLTESVSRMGGIDVVVPVVGGHSAFAPWQELAATSDDQWELSFALNVDYVFRTLRATLPRFIDQGTGGTVVAIGSINGVRSSPMAVAYGAAKAALINLTRTVALEYGRHGIRMNSLSLGLVRTPAGDELDRTAPPGVDAPLERMARSIPLGRPGSPDEVGNAVVFLASPLSGYITGQNLTLDGGATGRYPLPVQATDTSMAG